MKEIYDRFKTQAELASPGQQEALKAAKETAACDPMAFEDHHEPCCSFEAKSGIVRCPCKCHDSTPTDEF